MILDIAPWNKFSQHEWRLRAAAEGWLHSWLLLDITFSAEGGEGQSHFMEWMCFPESWSLELQLDLEQVYGISLIFVSLLEAIMYVLLWFRLPRHFFSLYLVMSSYLLGKECIRDPEGTSSDTCKQSIPTMFLYH